MGAIRILDVSAFFGGEIAYSYFFQGEFFG